MQEKRKSIRKPCSDKYLIQYSSSGGNTSEEAPIYLRDLSDGGISGTFFGEQIPSYDEIHYIQDNNGAVKPARLIWAIQSVFNGIYAWIQIRKHNTLQQYLPMNHIVTHL
jgi:hypothetical protein